MTALYRDIANRPLCVGSEVRVEDGTKSEYDQKRGQITSAGPTHCRIWIASLELSIEVKNAHLRVVKEDD